MLNVKDFVCILAVSWLIGRMSGETHSDAGDWTDTNCPAYVILTNGCSVYLIQPKPEPRQLDWSSFVLAGVFIFLAGLIVGTAIFRHERNH